jgi:hypothetical protein
MLRVTLVMGLPCVTCMACVACVTCMACVACGMCVTCDVCDIRDGRGVCDVCDLCDECDAPPTSSFRHRCTPVDPSTDHRNGMRPRGSWLIESTCLHNQILSHAGSNQTADVRTSCCICRGEDLLLHW